MKIDPSSPCPPYTHSSHPNKNSDSLKNSKLRTVLKPMFTKLEPSLRGVITRIEIFLKASGRLKSKILKLNPLCRPGIPQRLSGHMRLYQAGLKVGRPWRNAHVRERHMKISSRAPKWYFSAGQKSTQSEENDIKVRDRCRFSSGSYQFWTSEFLAWTHEKLACFASSNPEASCYSIYDDAFDIYTKRGKRCSWEEIKIVTSTTFSFRSEMAHLLLLLARTIFILHIKFQWFKSIQCTRSPTIWHIHDCSESKYESKEGDNLYKGAGGRVPGPNIAYIESEAMSVPYICALALQNSLETRKKAGRKKKKKLFHSRAR